MTGFFKMQIDWVRVWFIVAMTVFVVTAFGFLYAVWGIGAVTRIGSWQSVYWHLVSSSDWSMLMIASFLALVGFIPVCAVSHRPTMATIALVAVLFGVLAAITLPALN